MVPARRAGLEIDDRNPLAIGVLPRHPFRLKLRPGPQQDPQAVLLDQVHQPVQPLEVELAGRRLDVVPVHVSGHRVEPDLLHPGQVLVHVRRPLVDRRQIVLPVRNGAHVHRPAGKEVGRQRGMHTNAALRVRLGPAGHNRQHSQQSCRYDSMCSSHHHVSPMSRSRFITGQISLIRASSLTLDRGPWSCCGIVGDRPKSFNLIPTGSRTCLSSIVCRPLRSTGLRRPLDGWPIHPPQRMDRFTMIDYVGWHAHGRVAHPFRRSGAQPVGWGLDDGLRKNRLAAGDGWHAHGYAWAWTGGPPVLARRRNREPRSTGPGPPSFAAITRL